MHHLNLRGRLSGDLNRNKVDRNVLRHMHYIWLLGDGNRDVDNFWWSSMIVVVRLVFVIVKRWKLHCGGVI